MDTQTVLISEQTTKTALNTRSHFLSLTHTHTQRHIHTHTHTTKKLHSRHWIEQYKNTLGGLWTKIGGDRLTHLLCKSTSVPIKIITTVYNLSFHYSLSLSHMFTRARLGASGALVIWLWWTLLIDNVAEWGKRLYYQFICVMTLCLRSQD